MPTLNVGEFLDRHRGGKALLRNEDRLRDLGLNVHKRRQFGTLRPVGSGGVFSFYNLAFERRDKNFSTELIEFLKDEIKLPPAEIQELELRAAYGDPHNN